MTKKTSEFNSVTDLLTVFFRFGEDDDSAAAVVERPRRRAFAAAALMILTAHCDSDE